MAAFEVIALDTATPQLRAPGASDTYLFPRSAAMASGTVLSAQTAAGGDNSTTVATTAYVQGEIAALIASAPGALDTLDELAAAMGDDANFAATMTTALAGKLASSAVSSFGVTLIDDADAATARGTLGLAIGANVQAYDVNLPAWPSGVSATEVGYLDGVTSAIQAQLDAKAALASPTFTGTPAAPTASSGTNTTQLATTAFVHGAVADLIASAPGALDTLDELAAAMGDDANFAATTATALATKLVKSSNLSDLTSASTARTNLGATTLGANLFTLTNPSAVTFLRLNADNTVTARSAANMVSDLGLVIGTNVQAYSATLTSWAGKTVPSGTVADLTSTQTFSGKTLTAPTITGYTETVVDPAAGSSFSPDLSAGTMFNYDTNANTTLNLPASAVGKSFAVRMTYGGSHTLTVSPHAGDAIEWAGGAAPSASSASGKVDVYAFSCFETGIWTGFDGGRNFA